MQCIAGIDVAKGHLDLAITPGTDVDRFSSDQSGRRELVRRLIAAKVDRIVLEATGGYERLIMIDLINAGLVVTRVNPRQMRNFAKAIGRLAKTDAIDATVLAEYGRMVRSPGRELPDAKRIGLQELLARRDQISQMRTAEKNRIKQMLDQDAGSSIRRLLDALEEELRIVERQLDQRIKQRAEWVELARVLREESGVGPVTVRTMLIGLPELGHANRKEIAALVGLAPMNRDTGKRRGKRSICGGRSDVRRVLYMATLVASKHHPRIRDHYLHLQSKGKCKKVALVACMRKLLVILNAKTRNHLQSTANASHVDSFASLPS